MSLNNGNHKDVQIFAPIIASGAKNDFGVGARPEELVPTPEELCRILSVENGQLRQNADRHALAAGTMANIALCFAQMLVDHGIQVKGDRTVEIPREMYERMQGCVITATTRAVTKDGDVLVHIRERANSPQIEN